MSLRTPVADTTGDDRYALSVYTSTPEWYAIADSHGLVELDTKALT